jgi:hypothetical protein
MLCRTFKGMGERMRKIIFLLFISTIAFAQPKSIHFSSQGDYLVDENGKRTEIQGHPFMACYDGLLEYRGVFQKARGATIWLIGGSEYMKIEKPVCDLK